MRIAMVGNHFWPCLGGVEKVMFDVSSLLVKNGHEVKVICLDRCANSDGSLSREDKVAGIKIERLPFMDLKYYKVCPAILRAIRDVDVVHVHGIGFFSDFLIATKTLHRKPVVVSTHGGIFHTKNISLLKQAYFRVVQGVILRSADRVLAVSNNDFEEFGKICHKGNLELLENGINTSEFSPGKKKANSFLYVGRFSRNKRVELLLGAFSRIKGESFSLTIAGNDWENLLAGYLMKNVELGIDDKVHYIINPSDAEIKSLYSSSEFFVSSSQYEGFGVSLVEAMASGCIPIVQGNSGFREIIGHGEAGFLTDYSNANSAADLIRKVMHWSLMRKRHLSKLAVVASADYSWESRLKKLEKIYSEVVPAGPHQG